MMLNKFSGYKLASLLDQKELAQIVIYIFPLRKRGKGDLIATNLDLTNDLAKKPTSGFYEDKFIGHL